MSDIAVAVVNDAEEEEEEEEDPPDMITLKGLLRTPHVGHV
jgi:hypothetical protein